VTPNQEYQLKGCGFGTLKGGVHMHGDFGARSLDTMEWFDNAIRVKIPIITNVKDQTVQFLVKCCPEVAYKDSNMFSVPFKALRETTELRVNDPVVKLTCGPGSLQKCPLTDSSTMSATHWGGNSGISGQDTLDINLKNGWVLKQIKLWTPKPGPGGSIAYPAGFLPGDPKATVIVSYTITPGGMITYYLNEEIEGPKGIPFK